MREEAKRETDKGKKSEIEKSAKDIENSSKQVQQEIENVKDGEEDPNGLKAALWALDQWANQYDDKLNFVGASEYAQIMPSPSATAPNGTTRGHFGKGENKCNLFVADAYGLGAGVGYGKGDNDKIHGSGEKGYPVGTKGSTNWPPQANDLAQPGYDIRSMSMPTEASTKNPPTGAAVAYQRQETSGHAGVSFGSKAVIHASDIRVKLQSADTVKTNTANSAAAAPRFRTYTDSGE